MSDVVASDTRVRFHPLHIRADGDEWIVGLRQGDTYIAVPRVAVEALHLLRKGATVGDAHRALAQRNARAVDVASFVEDITDMGFVAHINGRTIEQTPVLTSFPSVRQRHVQWVTTFPVALILAFFFGSACAALIANPSLMPKYSDLLWTSYVGVALAGNTVIAWILVCLHEFAHLFTARSYGVDGRIKLGTRLQFLAAQTEVTGVWRLPRHQRLVVYLSGILIDVGIAVIALVVRSQIDPEGTVGRLLGVVVIESVLALPFQFLVFMRTDLYFVLQDVLRCRNLYADGMAYVRWLLRRAFWQRQSFADPSRNLPERERRAVRVYAVLMALGTAACIWVGLFVTLPYVAALFRQSFAQLHIPLPVVDALLTLFCILGTWVLWAYLWWRGHGDDVRDWWAARKQRTSPKEISIK